MKRQHWQIGIGVLVVVVLAAFLLSITRTQDGAVPKQASAGGASFTASSVVLKDTYTSKTSTHVLSGSVTLPNACYTLSAKSSVDTSATPPVIRVDLTVPPDSGICLQEATPRAFSLSVSAAKSAVVSVFVNDVEASTTPK